MAKKIKKKARSGNKDKRSSSNSARSMSEHSNPPTVGVRDEGASAGKERNVCSHIDQSVNLDRILSKISSVGTIKCEDCRDGAAIDRRTNKGRGKQGRKKGAGSVDAKLELRSMWLCLYCGHAACGGVVGDLKPQSHALRHARQTRHSCTIQLGDPLLCWCFSCNSLIPVEKSEENGGRSILSEVQELISDRSKKGAVVDVEDVWLGDGNVEEGRMLESRESSISCTRGYKVRGLTNLGNTCFFNSVMQNILAMDRLRAYFLDLDQSIGPMTMALRKLFNETNAEVDSRIGTNPKSLFGCVCSKAPQFRGLQQQDSHELLRYLLDGLHVEELSVRKSPSSFEDDGVASSKGTTFVDAIFGGQLSSTVCCTECGHSSIVYEPFLDLSLPVPTKKPPSRKAIVSEPKKKVPLKEHNNKDGKYQDRKNLVAAPLSAKSAARDVSLPSECVSSSTTTSSAPPKEQPVALAVDDDLSWLDYVGPDSAVDDVNSVFPNSDISSIQDSESTQVLQNDNTTKGSSELPNDIYGLNIEPKAGVESSLENYCSDELPQCVQGSEVLLLPYKEEISASEEILAVAHDSEKPANVASVDFGASVSSINGWDDYEQFDGVGDLFNEPETANSKMESRFQDSNFETNDEMESAFLAGNCSESNQEEVDNTNAQVSIDSCLSYFTKPELLCDEHAWHCESCSKSLQHQRVDAKEGEKQDVTGDKQSKMLKSQANRGGRRSKSSLADFDEDHSKLAVLRTSDSEKLVKDRTPTTTAENPDPQIEGVNVSDETAIQKPFSHTEEESNCTIREFGQSGNEMGSKLLNPSSSGLGDYPEVSQRDADIVDLNSMPQSQPSTSVHDQSLQVSSVDGSEMIQPSSRDEDSFSKVDQVLQKDSQLLGRVDESNNSEGEETDSGSAKVKRNATKRVLISKAPSILTIHLKRFIQDAHGQLNKLSGYVSFRDTLDLWPYLDPRCRDKGGYTYRLVGVVEHSGTMRGGHYVAYVKGERHRGKTEKESGSSTWFYASDSDVQEVSLTEVLQSEAYILFYEKI